MKSKLFTELEIERINQFQEGNRKDKDGLFYGRIKPKLLELLNYWIPKKKEIQKLIKPRNKKTLQKDLNRKEERGT